MLARRELAPIQQPTANFIRRSMFSLVGLVYYDRSPIGQSNNFRDGMLDALIEVLDRPLGQGAKLEELTVALPKRGDRGVLIPVAVEPLERPLTADDVHPLLERYGADFRTLRDLTFAETPNNIGFPRITDFYMGRLKFLEETLAHLGQRTVVRGVQKDVMDDFNRRRELRAQLLG